jgi:hypothetical protein
MRPFLHTVTRLLQEAMRRNGPSVAESLFTRAFRRVRGVALTDGPQCFRARAAASLIRQLWRFFQPPISVNAGQLC